MSPESHQPSAVRNVKQPVNVPAAALDVAVVLVTLLAPALGGSTLLWQQALLFLGGAVVMLLSPSRHLLPLPLNLVLAAFLVIAAVPLLPFSLPGGIPWRYQLMIQFQIPLGRCLSLQPWLTLEAVGLIFGSLVWAAFLFTRCWELTRRTLLEIYSGGVLALAVGALLLYFTGTKFGLWQVEVGYFGFFPHRNQTATLLSLSGILVLALAADRLKQKHWLTLVWLAAYLVIGVALVLNYSRAGVLLFLLGSLVWLLCVSIFARQYYQLGIGSTALFVLVAMFILFGGATWERFRPHVKTGGTAAPIVDFRVYVQQDALELVHATSIYGLGAGNFEPVFARNRKLSVIDFRAEHPDSDWVWALVELGWGGMALLIAALVLAGRACWPFEANPALRLRAAAAIAVGFFLVHGLVDVSGHRLGTVWPALFWLAMARHWPDKRKPAPERWVPWAYRGLALALLAVAGLWLASVRGVASFPTTGRLVALEERIKNAAARRDHDTVITAATEALQITPLDWRLYFRRASARALKGPGDPLTELDFNRARHLEPVLTSVPWEEAGVWLAAGDPDRVLAAWRETLRRAGYRFDDRFVLMWLEVSRHPELRPGLWVLTGDDAGRKLRMLEGLTREELDHYLREWLLEDPEFESVSPLYLNQLFRLWFNVGDRALLEEKLNRNEAWKQRGALWLAELAASRGDFEQAFRSAYNHVPPPRLPPRGERKALFRLERDFAQKPRDFVAGHALFLGYVEDEQFDAALDTIQKLTPLPNCPAYLHYLEAQILARKQAWPQAWASWKKFAGEPG